MARCVPRTVKLLSSEAVKKSTRHVCSRALPISGQCRWRPTPTNPSAHTGLQRSSSDADGRGDFSAAAQMRRQRLPTTGTQVLAGPSLPSRDTAGHEQHSENLTHPLAYDRQGMRRLGVLQPHAVAPMPSSPLWVLVFGVSSNRRTYRRLHTAFWGRRWPCTCMVAHGHAVVGHPPVPSRCFRVLGRQ